MVLALRHQPENLQSLASCRAAMTLCTPQVQPSRIPLYDEDTIPRAFLSIRVFPIIYIHVPLEIMEFELHICMNKLNVRTSNSTSFTDLETPRHVDQPTPTHFKPRSPSLPSLSTPPSLKTLTMSQYPRMRKVHPTSRVHAPFLHDRIRDHRLHLDISRASVQQIYCWHHDRLCAHCDFLRCCEIYSLVQESG